MYNFDCDCALCSAPAADKAASDERRVRITAIRRLLAEEEEEGEKDREFPYEAVVEFSNELMRLVRDEGLLFKLREYYQDLMEVHFRRGRLDAAAEYARAALRHEEAFESGEAEVRTVLR